MTDHHTHGPARIQHLEAALERSQRQVDSWRDAHYEAARRIGELERHLAEAGGQRAVVAAMGAGR